MGDQWGNKRSKNEKIVLCMSQEHRTKVYSPTLSRNEARKSQEKEGKGGKKVWLGGWAWVWSSSQPKPDQRPWKKKEEKKGRSKLQKILLKNPRFKSGTKGGGWQWFSLITVAGRGGENKTVIQIFANGTTKKATICSQG